MNMQPNLLWQRNNGEMMYKNDIPTMQTLSPRESEVLTWAACGNTSEEISEFLDLSNETIRSQLKSACRKLNANNKTHAVAIALTHGIIPFGSSPKRVIPLNMLLGVTSCPSSESPKHPLPRIAHKKV